ncbi:hypothetical protein KGF54_000916 [Candida jiufengensis]|uniref:uncharacterized protein n=1 Tax=Candida jiufengensis TaxID=497108 RepID=UPI0022257FEA|nr:uncharacterized protein KGF54_000916 [Candida jiufengensis]KAI5956441.1 hypothetical protein KGF54_000916 [Candida jiufengensis]
MSRLLSSIRINTIRTLSKNQQLRHFNKSSILCKDEKSKQMLKILGVSLQEGKIENNEDGKEEEQLTKQEDQDEEDSINQIPQLSEYESISHMSNKEFLFQLALDGNRPFMSFENKNRIDSKKIIKKLPDQINLLNKDDLSMTKINDMYSNLSKLDSNKEMHEKYLKRYFYDYNNDLILLGQTIRGIQTKFKMLRRNETDKFNPENAVYEYINDKMKYPYNVVGFDRSLIGVPLRKMDSNIYPREFIQDLPSFGDKINVKKFDLNFTEKDGSINIDPSRVTPLKELYDYENKNFTSDNRGGIYASPTIQVNKATHEYLSNKLGIPRNYIQVSNTENYKRLKLNNHQITNRIEQEIRIMKKLLLDEIKTTVESSNAKLLNNNEFHNDYIKSNQFILCEIKNEKPGTIYIWKSFSILPIYFLLPLNKRRERNLRNHLYKLFLMNLEDKIDILFKIKYDVARDTQKFMKNLIKNIGHTIKFRLWRYFKTSKSLGNSATTFSSSIQIPLLKQKFKNKDAVIYEPFKDHSFKRVYWLKKPKMFGRNLRRTNLKINYSNINDELTE